MLYLTHCVIQSLQFPCASRHTNCTFLTIAVAHTTYLSLGSNIGDRRQNLDSALTALAQRLTIVSCSPVYETAPWGATDQAHYLNLCAAAQTSLSPRELLHFIKETEKQLGRLPARRWGPRLIDIDILFYDDWIVNEPDLVIPHRHLSERAFVLVPLADIAPEFVDPVTQKSVAELLPAVESSEVVPHPESTRC